MHPARYHARSRPTPVARAPRHLPLPPRAMNRDQVRRILWADDEIDLLKPHIRFLEQKGYSVTPVPSGGDALAALGRERYDVLLIDEMMPGMGGLETLDRLKQKDLNLPVILITKSEEEALMEEAI